MEKQNRTLFQKEEKQKAIDALLWNNFAERNNGNTYKLFQKKGNYAILEANHPEGMYRYHSVGIRRKNYTKMTYGQIREIAQDKEPLYHWETVRGMFSTIDGEILRYILHAKIPLEKFIRYELASRGFDKKHQWVGFQKAEGIWLK